MEKICNFMINFALNILTIIFGFIVKFRNFLYDFSLIKPVKLEARVISIGNISVGGSGKTPLTINITNYLKNNGINVGVVSGGYKRKSENEVLISDGESLFSNPTDGGDEPYQIALFTNVPVIAAQKKYISALNLEKKFAPKVIILDDGFQHRKLHRDFNIVIIDDFTLRQSATLPKGRLREPFENLNRADVVLTRDIEILPKAIRSNIDVKIPIFQIKSKIIKFELILEGREIIEPNSLIVAVSAIANPKRYEEYLSIHKLSISKHIIYEDHHNYSIDDIEKVIDYCTENNVNIVITTEKDMVKIEKFAEYFTKNNISLYRTILEFDIEKEFYELLMLKINS